MKKLVIAVSVLALVGLSAPSQAEEVGVIDGVWSVQHDPMGVPRLSLDAEDGQSYVQIDWMPPTHLTDTQEALLRVVIPGRFFDCSAKKVKVKLRSGASFDLSGGGFCLGMRTENDSLRGVDLSSRPEDKTAIAQEAAKGSWPVRIFYGSQSIALHGTGESAALAAYKRDINPALNPDFFEKFGIK